MNATEALTICRLVRALCPGQHMDEYTPDAWALVLDDIKFEDAREALKRLGKSRHFIDPTDIRDEIRRVRGDRLTRYGTPELPDDLPDPWLSNGYLRAVQELVADGLLTRSDPQPTYSELKPRIEAMQGRSRAELLGPRREPDAWEREREWMQPSQTVPISEVAAQLAADLKKPAA